MRHIHIAKKYGLPSSIRLHIEKSEEGFFVTFPDHPELWTESPTLPSLIEMITDAVLTYYDVPRAVAKQYNAYYLPKELTPLERKLDHLTTSLASPFYLNISQAVA